MPSFFEDVARDIRHALRLLRRARGFSVTAVAVLAISIGANTAVFSVINSLLLRPLPYPDADRIVQVVITHDPAKFHYTLDTSIPKFIAWKQSVRIFSHLAAYQAADPGVNLLDGGPPEHLSALHVSRDYFGVFGARALHGRTFKGQEDLPQGITLMSVFAGVALLLAAIGFYGLMSYSVQQRTQEIGIRMALGAVPSDVRMMILLQGLRLAAAGVILGTAAALVLTRVMVSLVFGVRTYDPAVFAGVALLLSAIALVAAAVPAHRATRINPLDAVRGL